MWTLKKRCVIQQQQCRVISVLKIKGQLIIYLLLVTICLVFRKDVSPLYYPLVNAPGFVIYKKGCTRLAATSDKVYQLLAHGRWFSPGTPASSTTKTGRHDIAEILLKVALKHQKSNKIQSKYTTAFVLLDISKSKYFMEARMCFEF